MNEPTISGTATVRDAVRVIELVRKTIAVVLGDDGAVLGTVSDGDVRRAIMSGHGLDGPVSQIMNPEPALAVEGSSDSYLMHMLGERGLEAVPVVDSHGKFVRVVYRGDLERQPAERRETFACAVIMAGGPGSRLGELTRSTPKPMLPVGGTPLLERAVHRLADAGVKRIYIAVNYLHHKIEDHFRDGGEFGVEIRYLREKQRLGTAGALSLMQESPEGQLLVINGDVLTTFDYSRLYAYHLEQRANLTVGVIEYHVEIPYGVVRVTDDLASGLEEKPSQRFLCNAGIYGLSPDMLARIPKAQPYDMTQLIEQSIGAGERVHVFPIHEYWTDIGHPEDLERARSDVNRLDGTHG